MKDLMKEKEDDKSLKYNKKYPKFND